MLAISEDGIEASMIVDGGATAEVITYFLLKIVKSHHIKYRTNKLAIVMDFAP